MSNYSKLIKTAHKKRFGRSYKYYSDATKDALSAVSKDADGNTLTPAQLDARAFNDYKAAYGNELSNYGRVFGGSVGAKAGLNYTHRALGWLANKAGLTSIGNYLGETDSTKRDWWQWGIQNLVGALPAYYLGKIGYDYGGKLADSYVKGNWGDFDTNAKKGYDRALGSTANLAERALRANYLIDHVNNKYGPGTLPLQVLSGLASGGLADRLMDSIGFKPKSDNVLGTLLRGGISTLGVMGGTSLGSNVLNNFRGTYIDPLPARLKPNNQNPTIWDRIKNDYIHAMIPGGYITSPYYHNYDPNIRRDVNIANRAKFLNMTVDNHSKAMDRAKNINNSIDVGTDMLQTAYNRASDFGKSILGVITGVNRKADKVVPPEIKYRP